MAGKSAPVIRSRFIAPGPESLRATLSEEEHEALQGLLAIYSPLTGPVQKVVTYFGCSGSLPVHVGHTEYYDIDYVLQRMTGIPSLDTGVTRNLFAGGKGLDLYSMLVSSLGEAVERIVTLLYYFRRGVEHRFGTAKELRRHGVKCLGPDDMPLFHDTQYEQPGFPYEQFADDSLLGWVRGKRMLSGDEVWVPAQLVELVYARRSDEAAIGYAASGGLSCHINAEHALFHGITEVIERDAANLRWYCRVPPYRIVLDRDSSSSSVARVMDMQRRLPGSIAFYLHSVDIPQVPVVTAMEIDSWLKRYSYYPGGGADTDIDAALLKALAEFGQSERVIRLALAAPESILAGAVRSMFDIGENDPISKITTFVKVVAYYGYRKNRSRLDWYLTGGDEVRLSELPTVQPATVSHKLAELVERCLEPRGIDPIVFDFTPHAMRQLRVLKVLIPELTQPFIQSLPMFGHPRFYSTPQVLGVRDRPTRYDELNQDPLPYP